MTVTFRRHFQTHFLEFKYLNFTEVCEGLIDNADNGLVPR